MKDVIAFILGNFTLTFFVLPPSRFGGRARRAPLR